MKLFTRVFFSLVFLLIYSNLFVIHSMDTESESSTSESSGSDSSDSGSSGNESGKLEFRDQNRTSPEPANFWTHQSLPPPHKISMEQTWRDANAKTSGYYVWEFRKNGCFNFEEIDDTYKYYMEQRFYKILGKLAENPVGKVLCHLILRELDRENNSLEEALDRTSIKSLKIGINYWQYEITHQRLNVFGGNNGEEIYLTKFPNKPDSEEIYLFHEMLHWYHSLHDIGKYYNDTSVIDEDDREEFIDRLETMISSKKKRCFRNNC